jgi:hypothetical protein
MRVNNVVALFRGDKANIAYDEIIPHHYTFEELEKDSEFHYDDDYFYMDNVPIVRMEEKKLKDLAYKLLDLPDELLNLDNVYDKKNERYFKNPGVFIATDGKKAFLAACFGYTYPRFKAMIDKDTYQKIENII